MKLATLRNGTRDGSLAIVSADLSTAIRARDAVPGLETMQQVLDGWDEHAGKLARVALELEAALATGTRTAYPTNPFDPKRALAPLPRAYQWADGSAYLNHVELVRKARKAEMPSSFWTDPLMYQGGSDTMLGAREPIEVLDEAYGIDLEGEIAVVMGDVPMGVTAEEALTFVRLIMLVNDVSLRNLIPDELAKGFGFFHAKPSSAFSPVAVTPQSLGTAWRDGKLHLPLLTWINDVPLGHPNAGVDMTFSFGDLIAHAAKTRRLSAGTIIGSGTVSNKGPDGDPGKPIKEGGVGYTCLAEQRTIETILAGKASTGFLKFGDRVKIDMVDSENASIFGAIDQPIVKAKRS